MEIWLDSEELYKWLDKDIVGGPTARMMENDDHDTSWKQKTFKSDNGTLVGRGFQIPPTPLPLPFESIDGVLNRIGDNYSASIEFNDPSFEDQENSRGGL